jgi:hypothetical protein
MIDAMGLRRTWGTRCSWIDLRLAVAAATAAASVTATSEAGAVFGVAVMAGVTYVAVAVTGFISFEVLERLCAAAG